MIVAGSSMPTMTANKFERYCEALRGVLWNESECLTQVQRSCVILDEVLAGVYDRDKAKES
jgi:hypothetical protein